MFPCPISRLCFRNRNLARVIGFGLVSSRDDGGDEERSRMFSRWKTAWNTCCRFSLPPSMPSAYYTTSWAVAEFFLWNECTNGHGIFLTENPFLSCSIYSSYSSKGTHTSWRRLDLKVSTIFSRLYIKVLSYQLQGDIYPIFLLKTFTECTVWN